MQDVPEVGGAVATLVTCSGAGVEPEVIALAICSQAQVPICGVRYGMREH